MTAKIQEDDGPAQVVSSEFGLVLHQGVSRLTIGSTPAIESDSREVTLLWFRIRERLEEERRRQERASEVIEMRFKAEPSVEVQVLEDGRLTCPQCAEVPPWGVCELCDDERAVTLRRLEQWNEERPEDAWYFGSGADEAARCDPS